MVDEPLATLCAFVAHYRALGADEITLCLDRARPDVMDVLGPEAGLRLVLCDRDWWGGPRPPESVHRQIRNATRVYRACRTDWLLHVDADEFLWVEGGVNARLAALSDDWPVVRLLPAERVRDAGTAMLDVFEGRFRLRRGAEPRFFAELYGADARFFNPEGLLAHHRGKSFTRTGLPFRIGVHQPFPEEMDGRPLAERKAWLEVVACRLDGWIVHYDGMTPLHWMLKLLGRVDTERRMRAAGQAIPPERHSPSRLEQMHRVDALRHDPDALHALAGRLLFVDAEARAALRARGMLAELPVDPAAAARAQFPGLALDFGVAAFDAHLRAHWQELIAATGFAA